MRCKHYAESHVTWNDFPFVLGRAVVSRKEPNLRNYSDKLA